MSRKKKKIKTTKTVRQVRRKNLLSRRQSIIGLGILLVAGFLVLSPLLSSSFLNYDDDIYITGNPYILNPNIHSIKALFGEYFANQYAPVSMLIMALEIQLVGVDAWGLKLFSILFHLLNTFLVFRLIDLWFDRKDWALIVAALFCLHPIQLESIAWLSASMKIEAFTFFFLTSLLAYSRFVDQKNRGYYFLSLGLFLLSCFSKEQAVSLAVTLFAVDYLRGRKLLSRDVLLEKIPFLIIAFIFGLVTLQASQGIEQNQNALQFGLLEKVVFAAYSLVAYIQKLVFPINLSFLYFFPIKGNIPAFFYLSLAFLVPLIYGIYYAWKKDYKLIVFGAIFFLLNIGLAVVSQVFAVRDVLMADRYTYLPSIGFFILIAYVFTNLIKGKPKLKPIVTAVSIAYFLFLIFITYKRTAVWKDSFTVFSDAIENVSNYNKNTPYLSLAYLNRGLAKKTNNDIQGALEDYNKAIQLNAADHKAFLNRGNINFNASNLDLAIADYDQSLALKPDNPKAYSSRGAAYGNKGNYAKSIEDLTKALELDPDFSDARKNRMLIYYFQGQYEASLADCTLYLQQVPGDGSMWNQRGLIHQALGRWTEAEADFNKSVQLEPNNGGYYLNRSIFYNQIGNRTAALRDAQTARNLGAVVSDDYLRGLQ